MMAEATTTAGRERPPQRQEAMMAGMMAVVAAVEVAMVK
jgi:hypothetical protein